MANEKKAVSIIPKPIIEKPEPIKLGYFLVVINPFNNFKRGDMILDPDLINMLTSSEFASCVNKVTTH